MRFERRDPPRLFEVGWRLRFNMKDCGAIALEADEQVTFVTPDGGEYDVARKDWGFYATPSINARLLQFGLRTVLVRNRIGRYFVLLVEQGKEPLFDRYVADEDLAVIMWMDDEDALARLEAVVGGG